MLSGLRHALKPLPVAGKNLNPQFIFQLNDGFGHAWLRGVQRFGGLRQIQVSAGSFLDKAKLVQVHVRIVIWTTRIML
jgi:hypothetical protein